MVDTIDRHLFDDEYVIIKFNHTSCVCLSCYLQKELVSIVGSYCTLSLKSLVATFHDGLGTTAYKEAMRVIL